MRRLFEKLSQVILVDPEGAASLCEWVSRMESREAERRLAEEEGRPPNLVPIALVETTLAYLGIHVPGCSACAHTPEGRECPGCGNPDLAPPENASRPKKLRVPVKGRRSKKVRGRGRT
jgi:hypothetical protein